MHPEGMRLSRAICWGEREIINFRWILRGSVTSMCVDEHLDSFDGFWKFDWFMITHKYWLMGPLLKIFDFNQFELLKFSVFANCSEFD